jgi:hypothetical protein
LARREPGTGLSCGSIWHEDDGQPSVPGDVWQRCRPHSPARLENRMNQAQTRLPAKIAGFVRPMDDVEFPGLIGCQATGVANEYADIDLIGWQASPASCQTGMFALLWGLAEGSFKDALQRACPACSSLGRSPAEQRPSRWHRGPTALGVHRLVGAGRALPSVCSTGSMAVRTNTDDAGHGLRKNTPNPTSASPGYAATPRAE